MGELDWYVAYTGVAAELRVAEDLQDRGYPVFLPQHEVWVRRRCKRVKRVRPLFPRYLFVGIDSPDDLFDPRDVDGMQAMLAVDGMPLKVPPGVIAGLRAAIDDGRFNERLPEAVKPGMSGRFARGSFEGLEGVCEAVVGGARVQVLIELLGRKVSVFTAIDDFAIA